MCRIEQTCKTREGIYVARAARPFRVFLEGQIMDNLQYSIWQKPYQNAVAEISPLKLSGRIAAAETAIAHRMKQVSGNCVGQEEQSAMQCARQVLKTLKFWRSIPDSG
jgi:hypothetical protein